MELPEKAVHVWLVECESVRAAVEPWLRPVERRRAQEFNDAASGLRYAAVRGALRAVLARYEGAAAAGIRIRCEPGGKPRLKAAGDTAPEFNVSHSGAYGLVALSRGGPVGVDIELIKEHRPLLKLARRFFAPDEAAAIEAMDSAGRRAAFYRVWTRKEALVKALGTGLRHSLKAFTVSAAAKVGENALLAGSGAEAPERWRIIPLPVPAGYEGALAMPVSAGPVRSFQFRG